MEGADNWQYSMQLVLRSPSSTYNSRLPADQSAARTASGSPNRFQNEGTQVQLENCFVDLHMSLVVVDRTELRSDGHLLSYLCNQSKHVPQSATRINCFICHLSTYPRSYTLSLLSAAFWPARSSSTRFWQALPVLKPWVEARAAGDCTALAFARRLSAPHRPSAHPTPTDWLRHKIRQLAMEQQQQQQL